MFERIDCNKNQISILYCNVFVPDRLKQRISTGLFYHRVFSDNRPVVKYNRGSGKIQTQIGKSNIIPEFSRTFPGFTILQKSAKPGNILQKSAKLPLPFKSSSTLFAKICKIFSHHPKPKPLTSYISYTYCGGISGEPPHMLHSIAP